MLDKLLYYCFVLPISWLPLWFLHGLSRVLFLILFYIFPYRKKLVNRNLTRSFPNASKEEIREIRKKFYLHLCDLVAESVKNISISKANLKKRITVKNPELIQRFYDENKSVLLVSGHYNNWEFLITAQDSILPHQAVGIGKPLSSKFWDKKLNERRSRYGMRVIHSKNFKEKMELWKDELTATLVLSDQSPGDSLKSYWTHFLNQQTAVLFGAELMAHQFGYPVVFFHMNKIKRGFYEIEFKLISEKPQDEKYGFITNTYVKMLEEVIQDKPEFWVWTHKRWKREIPEDLEGLKKRQREKFEEKFGA